MNGVTLLITTAITPPEGIPYLMLTSSAARRIYTKAAIFLWVAQGVKNIVVADGTNSKPLNADDLSQLYSMGINIEQISYAQRNDEVIARGKGYAEGELIAFALSDSRLLQDVKSFIKCTGKVYCSNFQMVSEAIKGGGVKNIFWSHVDAGGLNTQWIDTRFYYVQKSFFVSDLYPAYVACDDRVSAIEHDLKNTLDIKLHQYTSIRPILHGVSGGRAEPYEHLNLGYLDVNFPCWANGG